MALQTELEFQAARADRIGSAQRTPDYVIDRYRQTRMWRLLPNANRIDRGHPFTRVAVVALTAFDRLLLNLFPSLQEVAGITVITGRKPAAAAGTATLSDETTQPTRRIA